MNERIQELFHESIEDCDGTMKDRVYSLKQSEIEKFAELIVEECIFAIDEQCSNSDAEGTIEAITILQKHFGVE